MDDGTKTATKPAAPMSAYDKLLADVTKRFKRDTASHEMTVLHDDGLYRHLRFRAPERGTYWFDLVTWPGALHIRGDLGNSYTFSRLPDMFEFFRGKRINPHYWSEKLDGGRGPAKEYSEEKFRQLVVEYFVESVRYGDAPRGLGKAVREEILNSEFLAVEEEALKVLDAFEYGATFKASCLCGDDAEFARLTDAELWRSGHIRPDAAVHRSSVERVEGFRFSDAWEWDLRDFDWQFLWACYAIQWGIGVYDSKQTVLGDDAPISALNFSVRVDNTLRREGIGTVGELVKLTGHDLLDIRNSGVKSLAEVIDKLGEHGRKLQEPPCPLPDLPTRRALNGGEH